MFLQTRYYIFVALSLCILVLFFAPTVVAFMKFVHYYNRKGFFDATELCSPDQTKLDDCEVEGLIRKIIQDEKEKASREKVPLRFYDYIHALDQNSVVEEFTKKNTKYRQYNYWLFETASLCQCVQQQRVRH